MLRFDFLQSADSAPDHDSASVSVFVLEIKSGMFDGIDGCYDGVLSEAIQPSGFLNGKVPVCGEVGAIADNLRAVGLDIIKGCPADARLTEADRFPYRLDSATEWSNKTVSCNDDTLHYE